MYENAEPHVVHVVLRGARNGVFLDVRQDRERIALLRGGGVEERHRERVVGHDAERALEIGLRGREVAGVEVSQTHGKRLRERALRVIVARGEARGSGRPGRVAGAGVCAGDGVAARARALATGRAHAKNKASEHARRSIIPLFFTLGDLVSSSGREPPDEILGQVRFAHLGLRIRERVGDALPRDGARGRVVTRHSRRRD